MGAPGGTSVKALENFDIGIRKGEFLGVMGPSGSGKTTLLNLLDSLTLKENILLPLVLDKKPVKEMEARLAELAALLGIGDILHRRPYEVSGGQQQRAACARALICRPSVIFADEPTGNLDSRASGDVMELLKSFNEDSRPPS